MRTISAIRKLIPRPRRVVIPLEGGIGNLLFIYAAGLSLQSQSVRVSFSARSQASVFRLENYIGRSIVRASIYSIIKAGLVDFQLGSRRRKLSRVNRPGSHRGSVVCVFAGSAEMV